MHPTRCKAIASARLRNDEAGAAILAQLLRADLLPEAWLAPPPVRQLRALLGRIDRLDWEIRQRARSGLRVKGSPSFRASARSPRWSSWPRRERLVAGAVSQLQQMRDLPGCVWPAVLDAARQPFRSRTWCAAMTVILDAGDLARTRRLGLSRLESAVRREVTRCGGQKPCLRIVRGYSPRCPIPAG